MDQKGAVIIGLGAIGSVLAYYGYTHITSEKVSEELNVSEQEEVKGITSVTEFLGNLASKNETSDKQENEQPKEETGQPKEETGQPKEETGQPNEENEQPKEENEEKWGKFWKEEYNKPETQNVKQRFPNE
jgi:uncharacterized membrane protein YukC